MKIVIADDEQLIRISLVSMIKEIDASWHIVGEAANGEEMLELIAQYKPEIAIVDIRMPRLDGIEVINRGKVISPQTKWIILSGFSDFKYAQEAVKLGVSQYLLKPVEPNDLQNAIRTSYLRNREHYNLINCQFETELLSLLQGYPSLTSNTKANLLQNGKYQALVFYFHSSIDDKRVDSTKSKFNQDMKQIISDCLVDGLNLASFNHNQTCYTVIAAWDPERHDAELSAASFFNKVEQLSAHLRSDDFAVTTLLTDVLDHIYILIDRILMLTKWSDFYIVAGINQALQFNKVESFINNEDWKKLSHYFMQLTNNYRNKSYLDYQNTLENMTVWINERKSQCMSKELILNINTYVQFVFHISLQKDDWNEWLKQLKETGEAILNPSFNASTSQELINHVLRIVEESFMQDISLNKIAIELNVSPSYLSVLFHKKTGTTFVKYLTRLRILKSKELLCNTNLQIQQVSERVGYYSSRHFTRLFVESVGVYPSDFRKSKRLSSRTSHEQAKEKYSEVKGGNYVQQ